MFFVEKKKIGETIIIDKKIIHILKKHVICQK